MMQITASKVPLLVECSRPFSPDTEVERVVATEPMSRRRGSPATHVARSRSAISCGTRCMPTTPWREVSRRVFHVKGFESARRMS